MTALNSYGSPSYYVETMFAQNCGDVILPVKAEGIPEIRTDASSRAPGRPSGSAACVGSLLQATRDAKSGLIYLKIVNVDTKAQTISVQISGATKVDSKGESVVLAASHPDDTSSPH